MMMARKVMTAILSSFGIVVAEGVLLSSFKLDGFSAGISGGGVVLSLLVFGAPIMIVGWRNSCNWKLTAISTIVVLVGGLPLTWLILAPFSEQLINFAIPDDHFTQQLLSFSFMNLLFLTTSIVLIELISDNGWRKGRRIGLIQGTLLGLTITILVEVITVMITQHRVHTSDANLIFDFLLSLLYAPVIWGLVVWSTNIRTNESQRR